ncbi:aminopeptidase [Ideonella azotifigens]|uniref:Aminopeptidase n=1 Tax=Ideonella azotifigens TaxID=513160 RepID=A0ABN1K5T6_9BURK
MRWGRWLAVSTASLVGVVVLAAGTVCVTSGCSSIGYLLQSAQGHVSLITSARPVGDVIADAQTSAALKERLALTQRLRDYAVSELKLPDNHSYRSYADLKRPAAVWNVVAAPELSLKLRTWCFPIVGCVGYRGYYALDTAEAAAQPLREEGLEVAVYPVPAYSTLGKTEWLGGDPLLNTFVQWPEGELARLIFHELAHQVAYAPGDTSFNEAFATSVERLGGERWLSTHASQQARDQYATLNSRREDMRAMVNRTRQALDALYKSSLDDDGKRARKAELMAALRAEYAQAKAERWHGYAGYDLFFEKLNNASLGVQAAYFGLVPAFEALFEREGHDFPRFYAAVKALAKQPRAERDAAIKALLPPGQAVPDATPEQGAASEPS